MSMADHFDIQDKNREAQGVECPHGLAWAECSCDRPGDDDPVTGDLYESSAWLSGWSRGAATLNGYSARMTPSGYRRRGVTKVDSEVLRVLREMRAEGRAAVTAGEVLGRLPRGLQCPNDVNDYFTPSH